MNVDIRVSDQIRQRCPSFVGAAVVSHVHNSESDPALWQEIDAFIADYRQRYTTESLKQMPAILATREAYKLCGKDPSRYRPSGEALVRRTLRGMDLYHVSTLVDLINLASIAYGYSIGGFDADLIGRSGSDDTIRLTLGIGQEGEPYEGIGRGVLNIAGLPVYRDAIGGIGTPTSDHERTKLTLGTTHLLAIVNGYDGNQQSVYACAQMLLTLLMRYAAATDVEAMMF